MVPTQEHAQQTLVSRLTQAWQDGILLDTPPASEIPADAQAAFAIQHALLARRGMPIAGWKIGAKADGPTLGSPLPADTCLKSGTRLARGAFSPLGLELEIGFRFAQAFAPREAPYTDDEVLSAIGTMEATIEIVSSRYRAWPDVDRRLQIADLQCHGALISGAAIPYASDFPFVQPDVRFEFDGQDITGTARPANPAGDPRRLLTWLVNRCTRTHGLTLTPDMIVTTGTYTGLFITTGPGVARGTIAGLPPVDVELHD